MTSLITYMIYYGIKQNQGFNQFNSKIKVLINLIAKSRREKKKEGGSEMTLGAGSFPRTTRTERKR